MLRRFRLLKRRSDGRYTLNLGPQQRELLGSLADQLEALLDGDPDDPGLRRLFPTAYPDDIGREAEWQVFKGSDLRDSKRAQLEVLRAAAERTELSEDEVGAWMQAVNGLRLVLGTRLDVSEDQVEVDPDHPEAATYALYDFLGMLLDRTVADISR